MFFERPSVFEPRLEGVTIRTHNVNCVHCNSFVRTYMVSHPSFVNHPSGDGREDFGDGREEFDRSWLKCTKFVRCDEIRAVVQFAALFFKGISMARKLE